MGWGTQAVPTSSGLYESMQHRPGGERRAQGAVGRKGRGGRRGAPDGQPKGGKHTSGGEGQVEDPHTTTTRKRAHPPRHSSWESGQAGGRGPQR